MTLKRLIVVSDTHGSFSPFYQIITDHLRDCDLFVHLGDGRREVEDVLALHPDLPLVALRGNCDFCCDYGDQEIFFLGGKKILAVHGHTFGVKGGAGRLEDAARRAGCDVVLYGHTHVADCRTEEGLTILNPGSPSCPRGGPCSFGIVDILEDGGIAAHIARMR